jgi:hypothetical protein
MEALQPCRLNRVGHSQPSIITHVDAGGGYTYLDMQTGHEFSAVVGLTYNLINTATHYQNGLDFHLDGGFRNSCPNILSSEPLAMFTNSSPATADQVRGSAPSSRASMGSARSSGSSFQLATCWAT